MTTQRAHDNYSADEIKQWRNCKTTCAPYGYRRLAELYGAVNAQVEDATLVEAQRFAEARLAYLESEAKLGLTPS